MGLDMPLWSFSIIDADKLLFWIIKIIVVTVQYSCNESSNPKSVLEVTTEVLESKQKCVEKNMTPSNK